MKTSLQQYKAIMGEFERLGSQIEKVFSELSDDPGNMAAVDSLARMIGNAQPYPSDMFRHVLEVLAEDFSAKHIAAAGDNVDAVRACRDALAALSAPLVREYDAPLWKSEAALRELGVKYSRRADGFLEVAGSIDLSRKDLKDIPDLANVIVLQDFMCDMNELTSLAHVPRFIGGTASFANNFLQTIAGGPEFVGGHYIISGNSVADLRGGPLYVGANYYAQQMSFVETLAGITGQIVGELHLKESRKIKHFEHAPKNTAGIVSDFGTFKSWDDVPRQLRASPEMLAVIDFREMMAGISLHSRQLSRPVSAPKTARFTRK